jgi:hypothetical protein
VSQFGGGGYADAESTSQFVLGDDDRLEERDVDASVRALRPRSSRRGSWDSEASDWSARVAGGGTSSYVRERSLRTSNSVRTDGQCSAENEETEEPIGNENAEGTSQSETHSTPIKAVGTDGHEGTDGSPRSVHDEPDLSVETPAAASQSLPSDERTHSTDTVAQLGLKDISSAVLEEPQATSSSDPGPEREVVGDEESLTSLDKDMWHSAPSTPMV